MTNVIRPYSTKHGLGQGVFIGLVVFAMLVLLSLTMQGMGLTRGRQQRSAELLRAVRSCVNLVNTTSAYLRDTLPQILRDTMPNVLREAMPPRGGGVR